MKKNTKIFNTEVIERLALSDNIPPFDEQRKGTQVIMIEEGKKKECQMLYSDMVRKLERKYLYSQEEGNYEQL